MCREHVLHVGHHDALSSIKGLQHGAGQCRPSGTTFHSEEDQQVGKLTVAPSGPHAPAQGRDKLAGPAQGLIHADFKQAHGVLAGIPHHLHYHKTKGLQIILGHLQCMLK